MKRHSLVRSSAVTFAAFSLVTSPVAAAAASSAAPVNPLVALSAFGTAESRSAVAASPASMPATGTASAAVAAQYQDDRDGGVRGSPLIALLAALGLVAAWFLLDDAVLGDDDGFDLDLVPISPN